MKEKMEKDIKISTDNKRLILTTGIIVLVFCVVYCSSIFAGGSYREFCEAAAPWVLMGIGIACSGTYMKNKEKE